MTRVRVDFNSVDATGLVRALLSRADAPIAIGDDLTAYDAEGSECDATVATLDLGVGIAGLKLATASWRETG